MARKRSRASGKMAASVADDFKRIKGIGPSFERQLRNAGIHTYAQLAPLTSAQVADMVSGVSAGQIEKQDWIGQASELAPKKAVVSPRKNKPQKRKASPGQRQHYATFTVELLQDEVNSVRRSRVAHIQSGEEDTWAGWQDMRLIDFLKKQAGLHSSEKGHHQTAIVSQKRKRDPVFPNLKGKLHIRKVNLLTANSQTSVSVLHHQEPYLIYVTLDLRDVIVPQSVPLVYKARIIVEQASGIRHFVSEESDTFFSSKEVTILLEGVSLPPDIYRLECVVTLTHPEVKTGPETTLMAFLESGPIEVY